MDPPKARGGGGGPTTTPPPRHMGWPVIKAGQGAIKVEVGNFNDYVVEKYHLSLSFNFYFNWGSSVFLYLYYIA